MPNARLYALCTATTMAARLLGAQTPESLDQIPVIPGSRHDTKGEALLHLSRETDQVHLYRITASIEEVFKWYQFQLGGESGEPLDSPTVSVAGITPIQYHLEFHEFKDVCADSTGATAQGGDTAGACQKWLRGKDKRRALALSRLPWDRNQWIEDVQFTWFCRDADGTLRRLRVEIRDIGLKPDWKYYTPLGLVRIESVALGTP
jgi:hypothetical protein